LLTVPGRVIISMKGSGSEMALKMKLLEGVYGVCRLGSAEPVPGWAGSRGGFLSVTRTEDELSVVCLQDGIPEDAKCERGWRIYKVLGPLDFSLVGILAGISGALAKSGVSMFAVSTYDTDYILVKGSDIGRASEALEGEGCEIVS
jgi:hypothetical protein